MNVYAVIHTGGKQYRVSPGDVVRVEKLAAQSGEKIEFDRVYLLAHEGRIIAGNPVLKGARVVAQVLDQDRGEKIIIFKHRGPPAATGALDPTLLAAGSAHCDAAAARAACAPIMD